MKTRGFKMKRTLLALSMAFFTIFPGIAEAQSNGKPDVVVQTNITRAVGSDFVNRITALPEWNDLVNALTTKIDAEYMKNESKPDFPHEAANMFLDKIKAATGKSEVSSWDVLNLCFKNAEAAQVKVWIGSNDKHDVVFSFFTKIKPADFDSFMKFIPPQIYTKIESGGNMIIKVSGDGDSVFGAFAKVAGRDSYIYVASNKLNLLEEQLNLAKTDGFKDTIFAQSGPFKQITVEPSFFVKARKFAIEEVKKSVNDKDKQNLVLILEKVDSLKLSTADVSGVTVGTIELTTTDPEVTKVVQEMAVGGIAFLKFASMFMADFDEGGKIIVEQATKIDLKLNDKTLKASYNFSNPQLIALVKMLLPKAIEEIKNNKNFR